MAGAGVVTWSKYTRFEANTLPFLTVLVQVVYVRNVPVTLPEVAGRAHAHGVSICEKWTKIVDPTGPER